MVLDSMMLCGVISAVAEFIVYGAALHGIGFHDVISAVTEIMVMVLHSMVLDSTPARLKLVQACGVISGMAESMVVVAGHETSASVWPITFLSGVHFLTG
jgi:hypothetical protein